MRSDPMFRVFVSSTFTDFVHERRALQEIVLPRLRAHCEQRGARFQLIDLRWGVAEAAALDQQTMQLCLTEIRRCQQQTVRPNFIVLLGRRYGWRPLPAAIPAEEFELLLAHMSRTERGLVCESGADARVGSGLYLREANALPPEYCLRRRPSARLGTRAREREAQRWRDTEACARAVFVAAIERAGWAADDPRRWKFEDSATHREIREGASSASMADGAVLAYARDFELRPRPDDEGAADYSDVENGAPDTIAARRLDALRESLRTQLEPAGRFHRYVIRDYHDLRAEHLSDDAAARIGALCESIERDLRAVVDTELARLERLTTHETSERTAHQEFAAGAGAVVVGRQTMLSRIARYLVSDRRTPFVIVGVPGSGKTTLVARACRDAGVRSEANTSAVIGARFAGATPRSTSIASFIGDICTEISAAYRDATPTPTDPELVRSHLAEHVMKLATADRPLWLFLDGLDQLTEETAGRELDWLPARLPKWVKVVASLSQTKDRATDAYGRAAHTRWPQALVRLEELRPAQADELLDIWLRGANRTLQPHQRSHVQARFAKNGLPLYLKLAFEEVKRWKSWERLPRGASGAAGIEKSFAGVVETLFDRLAEPRQHGPVLVRHVVSFLAASRHGLAESEILDLLSSDEAVMEDFIRNSPTERAKAERDRVKRLPWIVWSRIESDLQPYLLRRELEGTVVLSFYHARIRDIGAKRYLPRNKRRATHHVLADYFRRRADPAIDGSWSGGDTRGLANLPFQLAQSSQWRALRRLLFDYGWLDAKIRQLGVHALLEDFSWMGRDPAALRVRRTLELSRDALAASPGQLAAHLLGRLRGARSQEIRALLERAAADARCLLKPLSRSLTPPDTGATRVMHGHRGEVHDVALVPTERKIISCASGDLKVWDLETGALIRTIEREGKSVWALAVTPDGKRVLAATFDKTIETWEIETGRRLKPLRGHRHSVSSVAISADGRLAVSGSSDSTAKSWDLRTGKCLATFDRHTNLVRGVAFSPDARLAFSASNDRTVRAWDARTGHEKRRFEHDDFVHSVAVSADARRLLTGAADGTLRLWDLRSETPPPPMAAHEGFVYDALFMKGWRHAASCGYDHKIRLWRLGSKEPPQVLLGHAGPVNAIAATRNGKLLVSASWDGSVRVWDLDAPAESGAETRHLSGIRALTVTPDGRLAVSVADDREMRIWDLTRLHSTEPLSDHQAPIAMTADGSIALTAGGEDYGRDLVALDLRTRAVLWRKPYFQPGEGAYNWTINSIAITPDGTGALVGSTANELTVWDVASGDQLRKLGAHDGCINAVRIAPAAWIAATGSNDGTVRMWNLKGRMKARRLGEMDAIVEHVAVTSDGRIVVAAPRHEGPILAWDTGTGNLLWQAEISASNALAVPGYVSYVSDMTISPDDARLVVASEDHSVTVRDLRDGSVLASFIGDTAMLACSMTPDGRMILAGERSGRLHFLRLA